MGKNKVHMDALERRDIQESAWTLAHVCHTDALHNGWWANERETGTLLMLCVSELAEAMEGDRKGLMDDKLPEYSMLDVELADTLIRIFDMCGAYKIPIGEIMAKKIEFNRTREDHKPENRAKKGGKKY